MLLYLRKTGETPCARGERRSQVRVFAVAVVFVDVFGAAGYELAVLGSVVNPCRRCRRDEGTLVASLNSKLTIRSIRLKSDRVGHAARHLGGTIT